MGGSQRIRDLTSTPGRPVARAAPGPVVRPSAAVVVLCAVVAVLGAAAALTGLLWTGGSAPSSVVSVHGEIVPLYGSGAYRFESVFKGAGDRGSDAVTALLALPLLVHSVRRYRRGSAAGALLLSGVLTWFLYLYATMSLGAAYNELYLVYVALFGSSLAALVLVVASVDGHALVRLLGPAAPRTGLAALMLAGGLVTAAVWLAPLVGAAVSGEPPDLLDHSTTMVTDSLDLALITPATLVAAAALHRRRPVGYLLAVPLLGLLALLLPMVVAQTAFQVAAGVQFSPGEIIGPIAGFLLLGTIAARLMTELVRLCAAHGADLRAPAGDTERGTASEVALVLASAGRSERQHRATDRR